MDEMQPKDIVAMFNELHEQYLDTGDERYLWEANDLEQKYPYIIRNYDEAGNFVGTPPYENGWTP